MKKVFLRAEWRKLIMINFVVDHELLRPYQPPKTLLDEWQGKHLLSLVGFMFKNTRVKGIKIPFHVHFEEVNLRFYVRHRDDEGNWKRGACFISEIVPKPMIAFVANTFFHEHYRSLPMKHNWTQGDILDINYQWKLDDEWYRMAVQAENTAHELDPKSEAAFILEHYWGYTKKNENIALEYAVEHPSWKVYRVRDYFLEWDPAKMYGDSFGFLQHEQPHSVILAEGSPVTVRHARKIK